MRRRGCQACQASSPQVEHCHSGYSEWLRAKSASAAAELKRQQRQGAGRLLADAIPAATIIAVTSISGYSRSIRIQD